MKHLFRKYYPHGLALALGLLVLPIPLLRDLHLESAFLAATLGCLWAGISACEAGSRPDGYRVLRIGGVVYLAGLPLFVHAIINGCFSTSGMAFWLLLPLPSIFFGYSVGRLLRRLKLPYPRFFTVLLLFAIAVGGWLIEFYTLPQVYFFNHVWGYWPGPIYDEAIQLTGSLIYFRGLTLFWILLLWFIPDYANEKENKWMVYLSAAAIAFSYAYLNEGGIISSRSYVQQQLGGQVETDHFKLYYDEEMYTDDEVKLIAEEHEFYYAQIASQLELRKPETKIESYLYAHPWQKKRMVGAKYTSYVPVWLDQDQLHIAKQQLSGSLKHELVHVMAKQFGNKLFNASWSIGFIEGLAMAIDGGQSSTSTLDQLVYAEKPLPTAGEIEATLEPMGFYGGRSAANYITMGSFVQYLLKHYPVSKFKKAYRSGNITEAYGKSLASLVGQWRESLEETRLDSTDKRQAGQLFGMPSLFEKQCPHVVSAFGAAWDQYLYERVRGDTAEALKKLDRAATLRPQNPRVILEWAYQNLRAGEIRPVQLKAAMEDSSAELHMLYADAYALDNNFSAAANHLRRAASLASRGNSDRLHAALATRTNRQQWELYMEISYRHKVPDEREFQQAYYRTKIRALENEIVKENPDRLAAYSLKLLDLPADEKYMLQYLSMIHHLAYRDRNEPAERWIEKLEEKKLRPRHKQLLANEKQWLYYLKNRSE